MGTMIQALGLDEEGYRGARFDAWNREGGGATICSISASSRRLRDPSGIFLALAPIGSRIEATKQITG
jgi:hypothetical protein